MQKNVFQTDIDGLFLYQTVANELPLTPGTFNIPYGAYENEPAQPAAGKWLRRVGDGWLMVEDYRTTPLWVVETALAYSVATSHEGIDGEVSYPGWGPLPAWLTQDEPQPLARKEEAEA